MNILRADNQSGVTVAASGSGFVVAWASGPIFPTGGGVGQDGDDFGIFARRVNSTGVVGAEIPINQTTNGVQYEPSVAGDATGNFTVTWTARNQGGANVFDDIYARRFDTNNVAGSEVTINSTATAEYQYRPQVAMDVLGNTVIVWQTTVGQDILGQRLSPTLAAVGAAFNIHPTLTTGLQDFPALAMDADGDFCRQLQQRGRSGDCQQD